MDESKLKRCSTSSTHGPSPIYKQFLTPGGVFTTIKGQSSSLENHSLHSLVSKDTGNTSAASLFRGYVKVERLTIADHNEFIITTPSQMTIANDTSEGLFDGFDWEMTNLHNISACEAGSVDMQQAPTTGAAPSGADNKKPPAGAASKMAKKAWMA
ncbi:hypothetical protein Bca101_047887 [Brassica carinata]